MSFVTHSGNSALIQVARLSLMAAAGGLPLNLHAEGPRGTGKTTVLRTLAAGRPAITRIRGCAYNCDPLHPVCPAHKGLSAEAIERLGAEQIPMPFVEISQSARPGTVTGAIDLTRLTDPVHPEAALVPGTLARANRGIVFIDEINRLADTAPELTDILLDVMGTKPGRLQIEEVGMPLVELSCQVTVWAASNPDEDPGPLESIRRQLADRFDLTIPVARPSSRAEVLQILQTWLSAEPDPAAGDELNLDELASVYPSVRWPSVLLDKLAAAFVRFDWESLRALSAVVQTCRLNAALSGRGEVCTDDIHAVLPWVLRHRVSESLVEEMLTYFAGEPTGPRGEDTKPGDTGGLAANLWNRFWGKEQEAQTAGRDTAGAAGGAPLRPARSLRELTEAELLRREGEMGR